MAVQVPSRIQAAHQMALPVPSVPSLLQASHQMALPIPYGFKFSPEDHELIYILYRKVNGNSLPVDEGLIEERDLFGKEEPWEIFGRGTEKTRYFFVKLKKKGKSADGSNFVRTVGKGTWKGQDGQIPIKDQQGRTIGFKKNLVYKGKGPNTNGRWLMKEYHLHGVSLQPPPKLNDYVLCRIRKKDDGKKQNVPFDDMEAHSRCQRIGGNQDGEGVSSMSCAENSILGRKRPRIEYMMDYELPNLSVADATIMVESTDKERDHCMDRLGAENCVSALSEGISKSFMQDDDAEFLRGLSPIFKKFSDEGFGARLWTESEAEQMGDPQEALRDLEINSEMFC
ncbi:NAC domain-containing protein [Actinidia chinensis var. chinensis]|uniref:NAC domain-containing protein n=1 Tax=Actinidia chinensis var. chinensis TaxID=1590841 RepID=A0A2R6PW30_ACTCC|nr:NAC domain-containing protein [Actinidia chinensis var. chinensis]